MSKCFQTFVLFFCFPAPPLGGFFTAGSTSQTQYGWWRPSRSRRTQRGTPPQRQRRERESARGISAPNAAPQPPQPPPRARSARRALMPRSDAAPVIAGDYSRDPAAIGWAYTRGRRRGNHARVPQLGGRPSKARSPPPPMSSPPTRAYLIGGGGGKPRGVWGARLGEGRR